MRYMTTVKLVAPLIALTLMSGVAYAQAIKGNLGQREFQANCANCHGMNGKGGGPYVEFLQKSPSDLTQLAKRNGGVFPINRIFETIEGANVPSHGSRDMPIWGSIYRTKAAEYFGEVDYNPESYVRARILALIEYIDSLQQR
jgi:mono/diheme cytochrome c family protein